MRAAINKNSHYLVETVFIVVLGVMSDSSFSRHLNSDWSANLISRTIMIYAAITSGGQFWQVGWLKFLNFHFLKVG